MIHSKLIIILLLITVLFPGILFNWTIESELGCFELLVISNYNNNNNNLYLYSYLPKKKKVTKLKNIKSKNRVLAAWNNHKG